MTIKFGCVLDPPHGRAQASVEERKAIDVHPEASSGNYVVTYEFPIAIQAIVERDYNAAALLFCAYQSAI
jgi:hypothetical protein